MSEAADYVGNISTKCSATSHQGGEVGKSPSAGGLNTAKTEERINYAHRLLFGRSCQRSQY
jgi:hypothetical protein